MNLSTTGLSLSADSAIDLHLHTTFSDGRWALETLLEHVQLMQFGLVAITDHDRVDTAAAVQQLAPDKCLPVLTGAEMTATWQGELTDLLCFGFESHDNALNNLAQDIMHRQQENTREVYENLQRKGCLLPLEALSVLLARPSAQQPHAMVALLKEHGYGLGEPGAEEMVMAAGCTFAAHDPPIIVEAAHRSGAVCLLAHPGRGDGFVTYDAALLDRFRQEASIDGLEVYYPLHTPAQTAMYREYARRNHLLIGAGSDSHGPQKPPIRYRAELCHELLERVDIRIA